MQSTRAFRRLGGFIALGWLLLPTGCASKKAVPPPAALGTAQRLAAGAARLSQAQQWKSAVTQWETARQAFAAINDYTGEALALHYLAEALYGLRNYQEALERAAAAAALNDRAGNDDAWVRNQLILLQIKARLGETNELAAQLEMLDARTSKDGELRAILENERGLWHLQQSEFPAAETAFGRAERFYAQRKNFSGQGIALSNLGRVYELSGRPMEAVGAWEKALRHFERLADPAGIAAAYHGIGRTLVKSGADLARAEKLLRRSLGGYRYLKDAEGEARVAETLRECLRGQGKDAAPSDL